MGINAICRKTGLNAQQIRMQIISNNFLINTNGFKKDRANFESLLYQIIRVVALKHQLIQNLLQVFLLVRVLILLVQIKCIPKVV